MKTIKLFLITILISVGTLNLAKAQTSFHVGVGGPGFHVSVGNRPYYYHHYYPAAPVYYSTPAPVYYSNPAPVYYNPAPPVDYGYYDRPVVVYRHPGYGYYHHWYPHAYYHRGFYGRRFYR